MSKTLRRKKVRVEFNVDLLPTVTNKEFREYVKEAVEMWGGQRHPDDHLFYESVPRNLRVYERKT